MVDQAQSLRRLADNLKSGIREKLAPRLSSTKVIAVTSGKGGVGKTNFSVNLAIGLIQLGHEVLLLDVDLGLANVDVLLRTNPSYHLGHVVRGEKRLQDIIYRGPSGLKLIAGGSGLTELLDLPETDLARFVKSLSELEHHGRFIILDTGAGLSRQVTSFVLAADEIIIVTNPEPTAMTDAYASIKVVTRHRPLANIKIVMNQVENNEDAELSTNRLATAALKFLGVQVESLGHIPSDPCVSRSVKKQQPFVLAFPNSPAAQAVQGLARTLSGLPQEGPATGSLFFDRLTRFFTSLRS